MNTINEMCLAWFMWVNSNLDILIMTITLIVVAGLVLEVVRLKSVLKKEIDELWSQQLESYIKHCELETKMERISDDQVNVNVHLAEDMAKLQKKLKSKKKKYENRR